MTNQIKKDQKSQHKKILFELSRHIQVSFTKIDDYDSFLTQLVKINVSHITPLSMNITERDKYYQQALLQAIVQAKGKAQKNDTTRWWTFRETYLFERAVNKLLST